MFLDPVRGHETTGSFCIALSNLFVHFRESKSKNITTLGIFSGSM